MSGAINLQNLAAFALAMRELRENFPEHTREIDKCLYDVGQKLPSCNDPNCTCQMTFENFQAISRENAKRSYEFD
jgi:hypothetical protein